MITDNEDPCEHCAPPLFVAFRVVVLCGLASVVAMLAALAARMWGLIQ